MEVTINMRSKDKWIIDQIYENVETKRKMGINTTLGFELGMLLREALLGGYEAVPVAVPDRRLESLLAVVRGASYEEASVLAVSLSAEPHTWVAGEVLAQLLAHVYPSPK